MHIGWLELSRGNLLVRAAAPILLFLALVWPAAASAAEPELAAPRLESRWYGWQTLINDGASLLLVTSGALSSGAGGTALVATGLTTYSLGGPVIHFAHKNPGRGFASFALRVPMPILAGAGTAFIACHDSGGDFCSFVAFPAAAAGIFAAVVLDASALARDRVPATAAPRARRPRSFADIGLAPLLSIRGHETTVGLLLSL